MKKTIAVDVDDVLARHAEAFIIFSNQYYGTKLTIEDYTDHWSDIWHVDHDEIERRAEKFHESSSALYYEHIQEADEVLKELAKKFQMVVVTARRKSDIEITRLWLDRHYQGVFSDVHFVPIWEPNNKITKADICRGIGAEYLIDDLPRHCNIAANGGIEALLFGDYSWNRNEEIANGVVRVKNWQEVMEYFENER